MGTESTITLSYIMCVCAKLLQSCPTLCDPWTVDHQSPLSMGFSRQEYWSELHALLHCIFPTQGSNLQVSLNVSCIGRWVLYH